jgi:hypothetical protein
VTAAICTHCVKTTSQIAFVTQFQFQKKFSYLFISLLLARLKSQVKMSKNVIAIM